MNGREINYQKRILWVSASALVIVAIMGVVLYAVWYACDVHRIAQDESDRQFRANLLHIKAKQSVDENTEVVSTQK